jgi:tRNA dimethylallyltransferase
MKPLIAIVGPTASGKSALAVSLAQRFAGEVVACDSTQVYRGFDIGTAKPTLEERHGVPHHLMDLVDPAELFTAAEYRRRAVDVLADLCGRNRLPIFTAGTGLYLRALLAGLSDAPARSESLRARLDASAARYGGAHLHRVLQRVDPASAARISPRDRQKVVRALEIRFLSGRALAEVYRAGRDPLQDYAPLKIGLNPPRALLYEHIESRVHAMLARGWRDEVAALIERIQPTVLEPLSAPAHAPAARAVDKPYFVRLPQPGTTYAAASGAANPGAAKPFEFIGYREMREYLEKQKPLPETIAAIAQATRRYAKRQLTWFRKEPDVHWFTGFGDAPEITERVAAEVDRYLARETAPLLDSSVGARN